MFGRVAPTDMEEETMRVDHSTEDAAKVKRKMGRPPVPFPVRGAGRPEKPGHLLTLQKVCKVLGVSNQRVYVLVAEGKLHPMQVEGKGRVYYADFEVDAILRYLYDRAA